MNNIIDFSTVSAVTVASVGVALLIESALLKLIFCCLAKVKVEAVEQAKS